MSVKVSSQSFTPGGGLFNQQQTLGGLGGGTLGVGGLGGTGTGGGLFGQQQQQNKLGGGGLFGTQNKLGLGGTVEPIHYSMIMTSYDLTITGGLGAGTATGGGLFNQQTSQASTGGLFGTQAAAGGGAGLFAGQQQSTGLTGLGGGLLGQQNQVYVYFNN